MSNISRRWDLFMVWVREYFKHPLEYVRNVDKIVPGRLYHNMGHICKMVPLTESEKEQLRLQKETPDVEEYKKKLMTACGKEFKSAGEIGRFVEMYGQPCQFCDFFKCSLVCPPVCVMNEYKFIVIKKAKVYG